MNEQAPLHYEPQEPDLATAEQQIHAAHEQLRKEQEAQRRESEAQRQQSINEHQAKLTAGWIGDPSEATSHRELRQQKQSISDFQNYLNARGENELQVRNNSAEHDLEYDRTAEKAFNRITAHRPAELMFEYARGYTAMLKTNDKNMLNPILEHTYELAAEKDTPDAQKDFLVTYSRLYEDVIRRINKYGADETLVYYESKLANQGEARQRQQPTDEVAPQEPETTKAARQEVAEAYKEAEQPEEPITDTEAPSENQSAVAEKTEQQEAQPATKTSEEPESANEHEAPIEAEPEIEEAEEVRVESSRIEADDADQAQEAEPIEESDEPVEEKVTLRQRLRDWREERRKRNKRKNNDEDGAAPAQSDTSTSNDARKATLGETLFGRAGKSSWTSRAEASWKKRREDFDKIDAARAQKRRDKRDRKNSNPGLVRRLVLKARGRLITAEEGEGHTVRRVSPAEQAAEAKSRRKESDEDKDEE